MKKHIAKAMALLMALTMVLLVSGCSRSYPTKNVTAPDTDGWKTNYTWVFCHGLSGWGSYDDQYERLPYWGMFNGNALLALNDMGFDCYAASVDPQGSAWDRACELYAQLTGTRVDYGKVHSEKHVHQRYGEDFTGRALIKKWSAEDKINLVGHSFGGATTRLLIELMTNGSEEEMAATKKDDISPLFTGGKGDWIYSVTSLAAPHNGTTAYNTPEGFDESLTAWQKLNAKMLGRFTSGAAGDAGYPRTADDYAHHDLQIDYALELNETIGTYDNLWYFSVPCNATVKQEDGTWFPDKKLMETTMINGGIKMGKTVGKTKGGFEFDKKWLPNDGLVNTISATAPFNAPSKLFDPAKSKLAAVKPGVWNVFPTYIGDHMSVSGGLTHRNDVLPLYLSFMNTVNQLDPDALGKGKNTNTPNWLADLNLKPVEDKDAA
ncbi:MAG: hypothetical protein E7567_06335 [Ruminococcaceae bacterium]|nr:hypothetical protein [Oscillospiraceae bacterium]